jgi:hypothetical protein
VGSGHYGAPLLFARTKAPFTAQLALFMACVQKCMASRRGRGASAEGDTRAPWKRQCREACRQEEAPPWRQRARGHAVCVSSQAYSVCVCGRPQCVPGNQPVTGRRVGPDSLQQNTPMCCVVVCAGGARGVLRSCHYRLARWQHCSEPMPRSAWAVHAHVSEGCVVGDSTGCLQGFTKTKTSQIIP